MKFISRSQWDISLSTLTVLFIFFLDRLTKSFFTDLLNPGESLPIISNIFHFSLVHNTGIAFGLFKDQGLVFIIVPLIAIVLLAYNVYYYQKVKNLSRVYLFSFCLILGGAIGNLYDRITLGYVVDFFDFRVWPVFNVADSAITIGAAMIVVHCLFLEKKNNDT